MSTKYYYAKTNAYSCVLVSDGETMCECSQRNGYDTLSGVNLCDYDILTTAQTLKIVYGGIDGLYNMADIKRDFPNKIVPCDFSAYSVMLEVAEVE